jgi:hypothetical protein
VGSTGGPNDGADVINLDAEVVGQATRSTQKVGPG